MAQTGVAEMLAEQGIDIAAEALLNPVAFTTSLQVFDGMLGTVADRRATRTSAPVPDLERTQAQFDAEFERLVASLVQDAGRAAENAAVAVRPEVRYVRLVTPPCCSRCAILAGRVYRYSQGFLRHPNCDCVMLPTTAGVAERQGLIEDPTELFERGLVRGLSKADQLAIAQGADAAQVVNVRRVRASLMESGRVLARRGRLTPEGIYRAAGGDDAAVLQLLHANGYLLG